MSANLSVEMWMKNADGEFKSAYPEEFAHIEIYFFLSIILMRCID